VRELLCGGGWIWPAFAVSWPRLWAGQPEALGSAVQRENTPRPWESPQPSTKMGAGAMPPLSAAPNWTGVAGGLLLSLLEHFRRTRDWTPRDTLMGLAYRPTMPRAARAVPRRSTAHWPAPAGLGPLCTGAGGGARAEPHPFFRISMGARRAARQREKNRPYFYGTADFEKKKKDARMNRWGWRGGLQICAVAHASNLIGVPLKTVIHCETILGRANAYRPCCSRAHKRVNEVGGTFVLPPRRRLSPLVLTPRHSVLRTFGLTCRYPLA